MGPAFQQVEPESNLNPYEKGFDAYLETYKRMKETMHRLAETT
jgi:hypothetical protein